MVALAHERSYQPHPRGIEPFIVNDAPHPFVEPPYLCDGIQIDSPRAPNCCVSIVSEE